MFAVLSSPSHVARVWWFLFLSIPCSLVVQAAETLCIRVLALASFLYEVVRTVVHHRQPGKGGWQALSCADVQASAFRLGAFSALRY